LDGLAFSEDDLGGTVSFQAVMVDTGMTDVFVHSRAQLFNRIVDFQFTALNGIQDFSEL
jgi:hypothetical protein